MLLPYATQSKIKPWKVRVFAFSSKDESNFSDVYEVYAPPSDCLPFHLEDEYRSGFLEYFLAREERAKSNVEKLFDLSNFNPASAHDLDRLGDKIAEFIDLTSSVKKKQKAFSDYEMNWQPIWNSILLDAALCVGAAVKEVYRAAKPRWALVPNKSRPSHWLRAPVMYLAKSPKPFHDNSENDGLAKQYEIDVLLMEAIDNDPELLENFEKWDQVVFNTLVNVKGSADDHEVSAYKPSEYKRISNAGEEVFSPINMMWEFASNQLLRKYDFLQPRHNEKMNHVVLSLGDVLRPDTHPNWTGFPGNI